MNGPHGEPCERCPNQDVCALNDACASWEDEVRLFEGFGHAIRDARVEYGFSLRDVAAMMGVSAVRLGEVERGQRGRGTRPPQNDMKLRDAFAAGHCGVFGYHENGVRRTADAAFDCWLAAHVETTR